MLVLRGAKTLGTVSTDSWEKEQGRAAVLGKAWLFVLHLPPPGLVLRPVGPARQPPRARAAGGGTPSSPVHAERGRGLQEVRGLTAGPPEGQRHQRGHGLRVKRRGQTGLQWAEAHVGGFASHGAAPDAEGALRAPQKASPSGGTSGGILSCGGGSGVAAGRWLNATGRGEARSSARPASGGLQPGGRASGGTCLSRTGAAESRRTLCPTREAGSLEA